MRVFDSEIIIESNSRWYFRGNEITLANVLDYFKKNLHEDERGIYIWNTQGDLVEKGYVLCKGFPLQLINWYRNEDGILYYLADNGESILPEELNFYYDKEERIFCQKKNAEFLKMSFNRGFHSYISELLEESDGEYYVLIEGKKFPVNSYNKQWDVLVPIL
jgi:hypothetical protein